MQADLTIIANLQATCQMLASQSGQYAVDVCQLKAMDLDWLACRVKKWRACCDEQLDIFVKRLLYFGQDPIYQPAPISGFTDVTTFLDRTLVAVSAAFDQSCAFRKQAWETRADYVPDIYEHLVGCLEKQIFKIERELRLIKALGGESQYIAARLEDGGK